MSRTSKIVLIIALLAVALIGGAYLAGAITAWRLGQWGSMPIAWNTYWNYLQWVDQPGTAWQIFATQVKWMGGIGFGLSLLAWLILVIALPKAREPNCNGYDAESSGKKWTQACIDWLFPKKPAPPPAQAAVPLPVPSFADIELPAELEVEDTDIQALLAENAADDQPYLEADETQALPPETAAYDDDDEPPP